jgi:hypothetical protein
MPYSPKYSGSMVQGSDGLFRDFEFVFPCARGGFCYYTGDNLQLNLRWFGPSCHGEGNMTGMAMIQGNYGASGNLEVIAVAGKDLVHYWRESDGEKVWHGPFLITTGVQGVPSIAQSGTGVYANFEVVVPRHGGGGLLYLQRDNSRDGNFAWSQPQRFGVGNMSGCALLRPNVGSLRGSLEVVAIQRDKLLHYKRLAGSSEWEFPTTIGSGFCGSPAFIQATVGSKTMFEVVVPRKEGGLAHFRRLHNAAGSLPWIHKADFGDGVYAAVSMVQGERRDDKIDVVAIREKKGADYYICSPGPAYTWTGPFPVPELARVRLHAKVLLTRESYNTSPEAIINLAINTFLQVGILIELISIEDLDLPGLRDVDLMVNNRRYCSGSRVSEEMSELYEHRNNVGENEVVVYFVDTTIPMLGGCATHPRGKPGFVITGGQGVFVFLHELGHVLGLGHTKKADRLMTDGSGIIDQDSFIITGAEISKMLRSRYVTKPCC